MPERAEREIERLAEHIEPRWDARREQQVWARLREQQLGGARARRWPLALALAGAGLLIMLVAALIGPGRGDELHRGEAARGDEAGEQGDDAVVLADGSRLWPDAGARYELARVDATDIEVVIRSGTLRFDVRHDPSRRFRVRAGAVMIEVVGTAFVVERGPTGVGVEVERGVVRVIEGRRPAVTLRAGDRLELGRDGDEASAPEPDADEGEPRVESGSGSGSESESLGRPAAKPAPRKRSLEWRALTEAGEVDAAWSALERGGYVDRGDPEALMAAADVARLSKHPRAALDWLRIVVDEHASSPLAPLAAFTQGRLLLEHLGDPVGAAEAFARAVALAPAGPLVEDALAREVEALAKAGDAAGARSRAEAYVARYPAGSRRRAVERWGGLD